MALLTDSEVLRNLAHILKTNVSACKSIGAPFFAQLKRILNDMLSIYQVTSGNLNKAVNEHGEAILKQPLLKTMRVVKKEILTLLSTWIAHAFESRSDTPLVSPAAVIEHVIQPLFATVLADYEMNVPAAREPKVLSLLSISIVSLKASILDDINFTSLHM
uniref:Exportin-1 C-terminal domain-containing protein n=1 Tax=Ditylenchus dipsaci TaxID=166011 RepID=A0A915ECM6_9BILA